MTNPIEAARAALDQYTADIATAKRNYESAVFEYRLSYLVDVSNLSGVPMDEVPTRVNRLPVYIGKVGELPQGMTGLYNDAVDAGAFFVARGLGTYAYSPDYTHDPREQTRNHPVFAFFPDLADATAFLDRLAALMTPPVPVVEVVGTLGDLTPNQVRAYAERGGVEFVNRRGKSLAKGSMWIVGSNVQDVRNTGFPDFAWAYRVWSEGVSVDEPIEFTPRKTNPA